MKSLVTLGITLGIFFYNITHAEGRPRQTIKRLETQVFTLSDAEDEKSCLNGYTRKGEVCVKSKEFDEEINKREKSFFMTCTIESLRSSLFSSFSESPLFSAVRHQDHHLLDYLLETCGVDPNIRNDFLSYPIEYAKDAYTVKKLIKHGANISGIMKALQLRVYSSSYDIVESILKSGEGGFKSPYRYNRYTSPFSNQSISFLFLAETARMVDLLIKYGEEPNDKFDNGMTALMYSSQFENRLSAVEALLKHKADPDMRDDEGNTALMKAGSLAIAKLLVKYKADITILNNNGKNALDLAIRERKNLAHFLLELSEENGTKRRFCVISDTEGIQTWLGENWGPCKS